MWDGLRLTCPACRKGAMLGSGGKMYTGCPECGAPFDRAHEADWLVTWINAYTFTSLVLGGVFLMLYKLTRWPLEIQVVLSAAVAIGLLAVCYKRLKGMSVGIIHTMRTRWKE